VPLASAFSCLANLRYFVNAVPRKSSQFSVTA
jgi:hypothetical protein